MSNKSNVDVAFDIVSSSTSPIAFKDLWAKVVEIQEMDENAAANNVGAFYTSLLLDGRFINVGDNTWDLRTRYTFEKATLDTSDCYSDDEEEISEEDPEEDSDGEESDEESDEEKSEFEAE